MNSKTTIHIRTDMNTKTQAQKIAKEIGLPLSVIVKAYIRHFIRTRKVPLYGSHNIIPMKKFELDIQQFNEDIEEDA